MEKKTSKWSTWFGVIAAVAGLVVSEGLLPKGSQLETAAKIVQALGIGALGKVARDNHVSDEEASAGVKPKVQ